MLRACAIVAAVALLAAACATVGSLQVPPGPWLPDQAASDVFDEATRPCRNVRTLTAEIAVRGQVAGSRVRGRVIAGFERGGSVRLEAPAPFGAPIFILAARDDRAVIWFPRDKRFMRDAAFDDVIEALIGLRRSGDDLLALVSGCLGSAAPGPDAPLRHAQGWVMARLVDGTAAYVRRDGQTWRVAGGRQASAPGQLAWTVFYDRVASGFPALVRLTRDAGAGVPRASNDSLTMQLSQLDTNTVIDPRAFDVHVPAGASPITLDDLRQMGPLADRTASQDHDP
ncbi:MAG: hypothetical protein NTY02_17990 [Acidobacteria bacterium]|nr:hypothetical protein [Acidobacteriota bacterium]